MSQAVYSKTRTLVDPTTGEIVVEDLAKVIKRNPNQEPFLMVYTRYLAIYYDIQTVGAYRLLAKLFELCPYNSNIVPINRYMIDKIKAECSISEPTYYSAVKELRRLGLINTPQKGVIEIDPALIWRGTYEQRRFLLEGGASVWFIPDMMSNDPAKIELAIEKLRKKLEELKAKK